MHHLSLAKISQETLISTDGVPVYQTDATTTALYAAATPMADGGMIHTVIVGGDAGLVYTPPEIVAEIGDVVHFVFMKNNHTVTQSTFDKPCNKKSADAPDSGFMANVNNTMVPAPTFVYTVVSNDPTWWYCKQKTGTHCGKGMVFAINPTTEKTLKIFHDLAIQLNGTVTTTTAPAAAATPMGGVVVGTPMGTSGSCQCQCLCPAGSFNVNPENYGAASNRPALPPAPLMSTLITTTRTGWVSAILPTPVLTAPASIFTEAAVSVPSAPETTAIYAEAMSGNISFVGTLTGGAIYTPITASAKTLALDTASSTTVMSTTAMSPTETLVMDVASSAMAEPTALYSAETLVMNVTSSAMAESTALSSAETFVIDTASSVMAENAVPTTAEYTSTADSITAETTPTTQATTSTPIFEYSLDLTAPAATAEAKATSMAAESVDTVAAVATGAPNHINVNDIDLSGLHSAWTGGIQPTQPTQL